MQVDKGAIKFILSGANVMCPGLTSPGARMTDVQPETVVVSFRYFRLLWPPTHKHGRPLNFAQVLSFFYAIFGGHRMEVDQTLSHDQK